jgi:hypothetical protein
MELISDPTDLSDLCRYQDQGQREHQSKPSNIQHSSYTHYIKQAYPIYSGERLCDTCRHCCSDLQLKDHNFSWSNGQDRWLHIAARKLEHGFRASTVRGQVYGIEPNVVDVDQLASWDKLRIQIHQSGK